MTDIHTQPRQPIDEAFAQLLIESQRVAPDHLQALREQSAGSQETLERLLLKEGLMTEEELLQLTARAKGWESVNVDLEPLEKDVLALIPQSVMEVQGAMAFRREGDVIHIALAHPENGPLRRLMRKKFGGQCRFFLASEKALRSAITKHDVQFDQRFAAVLTQAARGMGGKDETPVIVLVDMFLQHALRSGASDIHIEPHIREASVRERVDGLLRVTARMSMEVHARVVLRIKVMANLATDEHAVPQDGKLSTHSEGENVDVRVSIVPTTRGEKIVMRLLVSSEQAIPLESLGLAAPDRDVLRTEMERSWGMMLVTGPTGSGKTTSLYAIMRQLESEQINISTIEDPVEYDLPGANQIQVNEKAGLTFATGLRSIVRQDPNIILVGEIRDRETAGIAINSAMTGHLVLSTLHTNDAPTAIPRLIDMGTEPFLIASTINVIIAQRLVRKICVRCRESVDLDRDGLLRAYPADIIERLPTQGTIRLYQGKGCSLCNGNGYRGRIGIFEILPITDDLRTLILQSGGADVIRKAAHQAGCKTMLDDGIAKALQGVTTIHDVLRVIRS
ncbi:Flp pilus assembly complex ATPase component TadA [Candidatus Peregrinibacteria bacterium]|nr:Flp pilus assembly complex ATPase component TadA [Candidatus Peregrinibacteria bacterium]